MGVFKLIVIAGIMLLQLSAIASAQIPNHTWLTLDGSAPLVIARGGMSGLYPDSSWVAYELAKEVSVSDVVLWCDVQLTKDEVGICFPHINLVNSSTIDQLFLNDHKSYHVNGVEEFGLFSLDFTIKELSSIRLNQGLFYRSPAFDGRFIIQTVEDIFMQTQPTGFWLNIQHNDFYRKHNLSMKSFIIKSSKTINISYISSPDIKFLQGLSELSLTSKLVFQFLEKDSVEPSTNQTYGYLLKDLTMVKTFAAAILVPKTYIWPIDKTKYLLPHTSLVTEAHNSGIQVFAADFANDVEFAYNHSYNPVDEYLSFMDNGNFSVDGVLSDFPVTASIARECFAHLGTTPSPKTAKPMVVISHLGASGDFPSCSDKSYIKAIEDGADVIDCPVQMSKDGIPFCFKSEVSKKQVTRSSSSPTPPSPSKHNKTLPSSLNWVDIQHMTPEISNPYSFASLYRNPKFKNSGKIISLSHFLDLANNSTSLSGVLIKIENAKYLAENKGLYIIDSVLDALDKAGYSKYNAKHVMIESTSSSTLKAMVGRRYELVYDIHDTIMGVNIDSMAYIKTFADSVTLSKKTILPTSDFGFLTNMTSVVSQFHSFGFLVYVESLKNEFLSLAFDVFSDPLVEINAYVIAANVDGVITDFPKTAVAYRNNKCMKMNTKYMRPVQPGAVSQSVLGNSTPPAAPFLTVADVSEPPLNHTTKLSTPTAKTSKTVSNNSQLHICASLLISILALIVASAQLFL